MAKPPVLPPPQALVNGAQRRRTRAVVAAALAAIALVAGMLVFSLATLRELGERARWVSHTLAVQRQAQQVLADLRGAGRYVLDSLAAGSAPPDLAPWAAQLRFSTAALAARVADNPGQARLAADLAKAADRHAAVLEELAHAPAEVRGTHMAARRDSAATLEALLADFLTAEAALLQQREADFARVLARQLLSSAAFGLLALLALLLGLLLWWRLAEERARIGAAKLAHAQALERLNLNLEGQVQQRTAALGQAREHLARLARELLDVGEQQRREVARALHDDLGQRLAALKMNLQLVRRGVGQAPALLDDAVDITDACITQVRAQAVELRPPQLDELGLAQALRSHVQQEALRAGVQARVEVQLGTLQPAPGWAIQVFRIVQEALRNALAHGRPGSVGVTLQLQGEQVCLDVVDDGDGLPSPALPASGLGLAHMRERAELTGGQFTLQALPRGTQVQCLWPLAAATPP